MMYIHYCRTCRRIHMLNGHKSACPNCEHRLTELKISYMDYIEMDTEARTCLLEKLNHSASLQKQPL